MQQNCSLIHQTGSCLLFSAEGMEKIDSLVGDKRFSVVARRLLQQIKSIPPQRTLNYISTPNESFPSAFVITEYMNGMIT